MKYYLSLIAILLLSFSVFSQIVDTSLSKEEIIRRFSPASSEKTQIDTSVNHFQEINLGQMPEELDSKSQQISLPLSISVLVFGFLIIFLIFLLLWKRNQGIGIMTMKIFGLVIIITACIFLIVAGFSKDQITPVIGLFGIIAGYLLGANEKSDK